MEHGTAVLVLLTTLWCHVATTAEDNTIVDHSQFEAAFQGRCGHGSACEQLCYELHDGMYECDCRRGFELNKDGYSCLETNATVSDSEGGGPSGLADDGRDEDVLYQKDASISAELAISVDVGGANGSEPAADVTTHGSSAPAACSRDCGPGGLCATDPAVPGRQTCECPLGRGGEGCSADVQILSPRFTGRSWLAFPALRAAYKHVQLTLELRPEAYDGIFLLTGERDDMAGDFMALLLHQGFVEFRFDCGSGVGVVRSEETVLLNQWNHVTLYRHRWDAWLQLNGGKHVKGRSKGLFSRITFREPLFVGGAGNTTGLSEKLPVSGGLRGCVRHLEVNDHAYRFAPEPAGDAAKGFGIQECTADRCSRVPCQHGGKCLTSSDSALCLCPLGFSGDLCETRVDLHVPSFNGSSYLRYRGLADSALTWLDLDLTLKPSAPDGLLLYNGRAADAATGADFLALYMHRGRLAFAFDLGTGAAVVRSPYDVSLGEWHQVKVSRTGRLTVMLVDSQPYAEVLSPGAFTQLSLPQNLYLGGVPSFASVPSGLEASGSFVGCVQKLAINGDRLSILAEALGGVNVDNCPHPCVAGPCGDDGVCVPDMDYFTCECKPGFRDELCGGGGGGETTSPAVQTAAADDIPIPSFVGRDSYLHFSDANTINRLSSSPLDVNMRFKLSATADGLLLWFGLVRNDTDRDFFAIGIERGSLALRYSLGAEEMLIVYNDTRVNDNLWHRVKAIRNSTGGLLVVDDGPAVTTQSLLTAPAGRDCGDHRAEGLYVGGMPQVGPSSGRRYDAGIVGCVADLVLNSDYRIQLVTMSAVGRNVAHCEP